MIQRILLALVDAFTPDRTLYVSERAINDATRKEMRKGTDTVSISWPIKKITNESSIWNTHKLKKRA
jgi:hypothetical protein